MGTVLGGVLELVELNKGWGCLHHILRTGLSLSLPQGSLMPLLARSTSPSTIDSRAAGNLFLFQKSNKLQAREFSSLQRFFFKQ